MNGTKLPFYRLTITSGKRANEVIESEVWGLKEAKDKADMHGKKLKAGIKVEQVKTVYETDTSEAEIEGW